MRRQAVNNDVKMKVVLFVIFFLSSQTSVQITTSWIIDFLYFKTLHLIEYAILASLVVFAISKSFFRLDNKTLLFAFFVASFYGILDETHQLFVSSRSGRLRDIFIDMMGVILGLVFLWKLSQIHQKKQKN